MLLALFAVRSVNLREIAVGFDSSAQIDSRYKRCQRFFSGFSINYEQVTQWVFQQYFAHHTKKYYLTIDRTNGYWGKSKINILTLGIAHEGAAIPLSWRLLDKAGNANAAEHQEIIEHFTKMFGKERVAGVLADREFASGALFQWFNQENIPFHIRIKEDSSLKIGGKKLYSAAEFFNDLKPGKTKIYGMHIELYGQKVYLSGSRAESGELMIVATNQHSKNAIPIYLRRWEIETLFGCLKSKGFRFEDTHLTHPAWISKLMVLLVIGFCWTHKVGEWRAGKRPIPWKKFRRSRRPQYSYFRYGLDFIRDIILHISKKPAQFRRLIQQLIPINNTS